MSDEWYVRVPLSAMDWLMGCGGEDFLPKSGQNGAYWWRSEFERRIKVGTVRDERKLPPSEYAELQVSLLNEIGLTLTAVAQTQAEQAETLKTYKLSLEGIQGLLVDLTHSLDVIAEVQANSYDAVVTKFMHIEKRLAQIEERLRTEMEGMRNIVDALGERLEPCKVCAGKRRVHALFERKTLENKAATVDEIMAAHDGRKPRKAGKRKRVKR